MDENNFEGFRSYFLLIFSVFGWTKTFWSIRILFDIDFKRFRMNENTFEAFAFCFLSILGIFGWTKTFLKASDRICYSFWAFSDERKHYWSIRILLDFDFKRFRMNENTFEAFAFFLLSFLGVFGCTKSLLKASNGICYSFLAFSDEWKHFCSIRILFAIDFGFLRIDENNFEVFRSYLLFILSVF